MDKPSWIAALRESIREFAETMGVPLELEGGPTAPSSTLVGGYVALFSNEHKLQFAVLAEPEQCRVLAGALLGLDVDDEETLTPDVVADAVCEIANVVAGMLKTRVEGHHPNLSLGLPLFVEGVVRHNGSVDRVPCSVAGDPCDLALIGLDLAA